MKRKKSIMNAMKRIIGLTCMLLVLITITGCSIEENWIAGRKWRCDGIELEFHRNGTVTVVDELNDYTGDVEWHVEDGYLVINGINYEYDRLDDTFLNIYIQGERVVFRRDHS